MSEFATFRPMIYISL